jgi:hypothetical protein
MTRDSMLTRFAARNRSARHAGKLFSDAPAGRIVTPQEQVYEKWF